MSHYYSYDENIKQQTFIFDYTYRDIRFTFKSQSGVFSKRHIDFGTHLLLQSIKEIKAKNILDIGCGIGVIGLILAKANIEVMVDLIDINPLAIALTQMNADLNQINNVHIFESDGYQKVTQNYDFIVSNPPIRAGKKIVYAFITDGKKYLKSDGEIIVVIQKKQGALSLLAHMEATFGNAVIVHKEKGYYIISSKKQ